MIFDVVQRRLDIAEAAEELINEGLEWVSENMDELMAGIEWSQTPDSGFEYPGKNFKFHHIDISPGKLIGYGIKHINKSLFESPEFKTHMKEQGVQSQNLTLPSDEEHAMRALASLRNHRINDIIIIQTDNDNCLIVGSKEWMENIN